MDDTFDVTLRTAVYRHFATTGQSPTVDAMREALGATIEQVTDGYRRLYAKRMLVPAGDFEADSYARLACGGGLGREGLFRSRSGHAQRSRDRTARRHV